MLQLIKISQKLIDYNIRLRINRETFIFTPEQRAAGHIDLCIKLSEFDLADTRHASQLRNALLQMAKHPLKLAYKLGDHTFYTQFDHLLNARSANIRADGGLNSAMTSMSSVFLQF